MLIESSRAARRHGLQRDNRPDQLTAWFANAFVDGFPWVMPANVVGMSQHADGAEWRRNVTQPAAPTSTG